MCWQSFSVDVPLLSVGIIGPNIVMASAKDIHLHRLDQTLTADKNVASASDKLKLTSLTSHNTPRPLFIRTHNRLCVYIDNTLTPVSRADFHLFSADNNREYFSVNTAARVEALGFSYPYIFAITSSTIEVFSSLLQQQITTVPFPAAVLNSIPGRFLAGDQNILLTTETRSGPLFVTVNDAFRIHCADLQSQVLRSLKMDHIPHAISLLNSVEWDDKSKQIALLQRAELVGAASHMSAGKYQDGLNIYFRLGSNPKDVLFAYAGDCLPKDISALGGDLVSIGLSQQTFIRQSSQAGHPASMHSGGGLGLGAHETLR
ncbi:hypothetical protein H696_02108 [Fonticula alba]|uniref:CNH domain-containing protein n=1 Tax=Fonticula alba TaxID=691883 RepID=A0A058ZB60_FONAL|nr:hypothetical protein H696_02108 [Fonticula alba]KCV71158.1 hypothetical protein H696_02108 [Fonticula alba]|eukprot:XP_009494281.1 hypothetical protein H696_02108 [Fonticula alba]